MDISNIAMGTIAPAIARRARWSWVGYGAAAYVFLRVAKRYGWFGDVPARALDTMENVVRSTVGLSQKSRADKGASAAF